MMVTDGDNGLMVLQFPNLLPFPELRHGVFARHGGTSSHPYRSLNVGMQTGDRPDHVQRNRDIVSNHFDGLELIFLKQIHGNGVRVISDPPGEPDRGDVLEGDAVVSDLPNRMLAIQVADCQAVLLYDRAKRVIANVHSGWRGSIGNILGKTVATMMAGFGSLPAGIIAGVGPSLGPCCGEFINYRDEIPPAFWHYRDESDHFDFWSVSRDQLKDAGIPAGNIHISGICTKCHTDRFFSYRGEGRTGRFAAFIGLG